jgi:nucleoside-triphosphatase
MITDIKIGITGLPGSGKTYALLRVINMLKEEELLIGGMVDEPIETGRKKTGFTVRNLLTGEKEVFASTEYESKIMVGKMGLDLEKLEKVGVNALKEAIEKCDIIVIDEVGKMEVESEAFVEAVKETLEADKPMIITLHKKSRNPLLQDIRRRDDVRILEVTPTNRNLLPYKIVRLMHGEND